MDSQPSLEAQLHGADAECAELRADKSVLKEALSNMGGWYYALTGRMSKERIDRVLQIMLESEDSHTAVADPTVEPAIVDHDAGGEAKIPNSCT